MKKLIAILLFVSFELMLSSLMGARVKINCSGYDGGSIFDCIDEGNKICTSIVINGEAFQCGGKKVPRITEHDPYL